MAPGQHTYDVHKLHLKKRKYYASVKLPEAVRHLHPEPRMRLSTGESDRNHAERVARDKTVPEIHRRIDYLFDKLDPFVEGLRHILEREGIDVGQWYREGKITHTVTGDKTLSAQVLGVKTVLDEDGKAVALKEEWEANNYADLCGIVTGLGYAVPNQLLNLLSDDTQAKIRDRSTPRSLSPKDAINMARESAHMPPELMDRVFEKLGEPRAPVKIDEGKPPVVMFSDLAQRYIDAKAPNDSDDVHSKRQKSCAMFLRVNGDKPIGDYDKLHMIEMARFMDHDDDGKQWGNATIKNYVSYTKQAFDYAGEMRGADGKVLLPHHPMHEFKLSSYGRKGQSYLPFKPNELMQLFSLDMPHEDRLLLAILTTTGMRLDEAALMTYERVIDHEGVLSFCLVPDAATDEEIKVKNKQSMRYIPVPEVIRPMLGNFGEGRLFSYRIDSEGKAENAASKALMRHIRQITDTPRKAVHSLRGTLKDLVRDSGVSKEINDFITGHGQGDVSGDRYGDGPSMKVRKQVLDGIKHPWLKP